MLEVVFDRFFDLDDEGRLINLQRGRIEEFAFADEQSPALGILSGMSHRYRAWWIGCLEADGMAFESPIFTGGVHLDGPIGPTFARIDESVSQQHDGVEGVIQFFPLSKERGMAGEIFEYLTHNTAEDVAFGNGDGLIGGEDFGQSEIAGGVGLYFDMMLAEQHQAVEFITTNKFLQGDAQACGAEDIVVSQARDLIVSVDLLAEFDDARVFLV